MSLKYNFLLLSMAETNIFSSYQISEHYTGNKTTKIDEIFTFRLEKTVISYNQCKCHQLKSKFIYSFNNKKRTNERLQIAQEAQIIQSRLLRSTFFQFY